MSRMYRTNNDEMYAIGDILRYDSGCTALMKVTYISEGHGGALARYYGIQCMGGYCGAYHDQCEPASAEDLTKWEDCDKWRRDTRETNSRGIVGAVEGG